MSDLMKLIGDYAEQRVASSLLVQDRDADAAESFAIEDRLVREITDAHAAEIRRAKVKALRAARIELGTLAHCINVTPWELLDALDARIKRFEAA